MKRLSTQENLARLEYVKCWLDITSKALVLIHYSFIVWGHVHSLQLPVFGDSTSVEQRQLED